MATVVCHRDGCKFKDGAGCCTKPYVILNAVGVCGEWFDKNGNPRPAPYYSTVDGPYPTVNQEVEIEIDENPEEPEK